MSFKKLSFLSLNPGNEMKLLLKLAYDNFLLFEKQSLT